MRMEKIDNPCPRATLVETFVWRTTLVEPFVWARFRVGEW